MAPSTGSDNLLRLFWDASYEAMRASHAMRTRVKSLTGNGGVTPTAMPEETTTSNFVLRLAAYAPSPATPGTRATGKVAAILHNRAVEGGGKRKGGIIAPPSGADLELAVGLPSGKWFNFLLQAKRLYVKDAPKNSAYDDWNKKKNGIPQNTLLTTWAQRNGQTPGMLLYNDLVPPFRDAGCYGTWSSHAFGACGGANRLQFHGYESMLNLGYDTIEGTPAGVSMCLDPGYMQRAGISAKQLSPVHFPIEHLTHGNDCWSKPLAEPSHGTTPDLDAKREARDLTEHLQNDPPRWAKEILDGASGDMVPMRESVQELDLLASVALDFTNEGTFTL